MGKLIILGDNSIAVFLYFTSDMPPDGCDISAGNMDAKVLMNQK
jgi:hypothetical protein